MYIEWTERAADKIADKIQGQEGFLQLKYDTDGCGRCEWCDSPMVSQRT